MRKILFPCLLLAPMFSGCAAIAGGASSVFVADQLLDNNSYVAEVAVDSRELWASAKTTLSYLSTRVIDVDDDLRTAKASYDQGTVYVQVETFDVGRSTLRVRATKFGLNAGELAREVQRRILREAEH